jgi:tryptophan synthase alpha chain
MGRIGTCFEALRSNGKSALIPFITAGDPDLATTEELVLAIADAGADVIEIGIPFSDPIGDGPAIQRAGERALASGTTLERVLELVGRLRSQLDLPVVLMGYANVLLTMGGEKFSAAAREVGVDGVITVDLPPEEGREFFDSLIGEEVDPVLLASPTTEAPRLAMLADSTRGFLYYVSLTGVTGARTQVAEGLEAAVGSIHALSKIPVCVGFGVSTPEQVAEIAGYAEGVVVGSALVNRIADAGSSKAAVAAAAQFVAELKRPLL